jgi:hypothetical protein
MLLPDDPETPQQQNEKLCWTTFRYSAISEGNMLFGNIDVERRTNRDQLTARTLEILAYRAMFSSLKWNTFNVNLLIVPR